VSHQQWFEEVGQWEEFEEGLAATQELTAERLRELFDYDADAGLFTRRTGRGGGRAGAAVGTEPNNGDGYCQLGVDGSKYLVHRLVWLYVHGEWPKQQIDHIDGNRMNNRLANLRDTSSAVNARNKSAPRRDNKSTGILGVTKTRTGFVAQLKVGKKNHYLGTYANPEDAQRAYSEAKRSMHQQGITATPTNGGFSR
jgi:hypothetical protein